MPYDQAQYKNMVEGDPTGFLQFMRDWAAGGEATHQIYNPQNQGLSSYEQVLMDLQNRGIDTSSLAQHATAAPAAGVGTPDPAYDAYYQNALRQLGTDRDAQLATNDYSRFLAQQRGQRELGNLTQQWNTQREKLPGDYIRRGVYGSGSGLYTQGLQNYARDRGQSEAGATDTYNQALRSYDLTADEIRRKAQQGALNLDAERQSRYQGTSAKLAAAQPYTV
jgi:hypothetical protein